MILNKKVINILFAFEQKSQISLPFCPYPGHCQEFSLHIAIIIIIIIINATLKSQKCDLKKCAEKVLKYKDLTIEIQRVWNVKTKVIPVIIGATETISKSFRKYVSNIPGNHEVKELQKTAILGTAHILRKVLM